MDLTSDFRELFTAASRGGDRGGSAYASPPSHVVDERGQRLTDAIASVQGLIEKALATCQRRITAALACMDTFSPFVTSSEKALLLSEAELATAAASAKVLMEALQTAAARQRDAAVAGTSPSLSDANGWLRRALENTTKGKAEPPAADVDLNLCGDHMTHFESVMTVLTGRVSQAQLKLTLCKEEVALYKTERYAFGRAGILSCSDPSLSVPQHGEGNRPAQARSPSPSANAAVPSKNRATGFGFVTDVSKRTMTTVDDVLRKTSATVKGAGALAVDTRLGAAFSTLRAGIEHLDVDLFRDKTRSAGSEDPQVGSPVPQFSYTEDERAALETQNADLLLEQREASTLEAKALEASVRELAQLTTIMNEKVVEQSEQFSILLKNTDVAHKNVQKALQEVQKPKNAFWSSTRQLIALLWVSTVVLIVANWCVR